MHSELLSQLFSSAAVCGALSDEARIEAMLAFEAALALSEAETGLIPGEAAASIENACKTFVPDIAALAAATKLAGNPAIPFVKALTDHCQEPGRGWVHWGATSQDVIDTAASLTCRRAITAIDADIVILGDALARTAEAHRTTAMPARTLLQPALPTTFGFKAAGWLDMLTRCRASLRLAADQALVLQFGGAAGTLAAIGPHADAVRASLGKRLGLTVPDIAWHSARDRVVRLGSELAILTGALAKIAGDIALLMQAEVGEAAEPAGPGRGGSSTLPHKRNPVAALAVRAAAIRASGLAASLIAALPQEHERGAGGWHAEWAIAPELFDVCASALEHVRDTILGLEIRPDRMRANLDIAGGTLMSESLMMALAPRLGRLEAHHLVEAAAKRAIAENRMLADVCQDTPEIAGILGAEGIAAALEPTAYLGNTDATIDKIIERWTSQRA